MNEIEYIHCDVPPGMSLRDYRRTLAPHRRRRRHLHLHAPRRRRLTRAA